MAYRTVREAGEAREMTRLEEIEARISTAKENAVFTELEEDDFLYAVDCYRSRVAILEEALQDAVFFVDNPAQLIEMGKVLDLTPEQCLERIAKHGEEG